MSTQHLAYAENKDQQEPDIIKIEGENFDRIFALDQKYDAEIERLNSEAAALKARHEAERNAMSERHNVELNAAGKQLWDEVEAVTGFGRAQYDFCTRFATFGTIYLLRKETPDFTAASDKGINYANNF